MLNEQDNKVKESKTQIESLRGTTTELEVQLFEKNNQLMKQQSEIEESKELLEKKKKALTKKEKEVINNKKKIDEIKSDLEELSEENDSLEKEVKESQKVSTSKKITSPIPKKSTSKKTVATSSAPVSSVSRGNSNKRSQGVVFEATNYIAMCSTGCTGITATGVDVRNTITVGGLRVIAVDPNVIPLYSIVKVSTSSGSFTAQALDTGGAIKGHRIDILVGSTQTALNFGRQKVSVQILRSGK